MEIKRLIKKSSADVRDTVLKTTPCFPSFPGIHDSDGTFQESDAKSYSRMMNQHTIELQKQRGEKDQLNIDLTGITPKSGK